MDPVIDPDADAFLRAHSRTFLLGLRADGSPTGWPMVGLYPGGALEFSTYGASQKVQDFARDARACCVVAPADGDRALVLRGSCAVVDGRHEPSTPRDTVPEDLDVDDGVAQRARARMKSGKRIVLRFTPAQAEFVPGFGTRGTP